MHGVIVERDSESRDLLARVLAGLDWNAEAFSDLSEAEAHIPKAWALFIGAETVSDVDPQATRRLRRQAPGAVIVLIQSSQNDTNAAQLREVGVDIVLTRPLEDLTVIDAMGQALMRRRR